MYHMLVSFIPQNLKLKAVTGNYRPPLLHFENMVSRWGFSSCHKQQHFFSSAAKSCLVSRY